MRALIVTSLHPSPADPGRGSFVRDQVVALRGLDGVEVELFSHPPGALNYLRGARALRRAHGADRFDVVHAHFGLSAWTALALRGAPHALTVHGTDVAHPLSGRVTRAALPWLTLPAAVSATLASRLGEAGARRRIAVLPCGVDLGRFAPIERREARGRLGLDPDRPCLLFPAGPARPAKRHDLARRLAGDVRLLALSHVDPAEVPLYVNAANAVIAPSDREGFGLAVLEALACDVPVLATPVGVAPIALAGIAGTLCAPFELDAWRAALRPHLDAPDPRIAGRARAELFCARRMAERVAVAWAELGPASGGPLTRGRSATGWAKGLRRPRGGGVR